MGQSMTYDPPKLSEAQLETLQTRLNDAADRMSDDQILCLADSLHDALRSRRQLRRRFLEHLEVRLVGEAHA